MNATIGSIIIIAILLGMSAFFSASETALMVLNRVRLRHMVSRKVRNSRIIYKLVSDLDRLIATILVGNNCVNVAISVVVAILFTEAFGNTLFIAFAATLVVSALILFFAEILPKTFALRKSERVAIEVSPFMEIMVVLLSPASRFFSTISNAVMAKFGIKTKAHSPLISEEEVRLMIEAGRDEGLFGEEQHKMLHRIFEFGTTLVKDVLVPRDKIVAIDITSSQDKLLTVMAEEGHSRIVAYRGTIDDIVGIIYVGDVLHILRNAQLVNIPDLLSQAYSVSPDKRVSDLLKDFQRMKIQIAVVVDQKGTTQGIVTLEDLIEEIVGEV